MKNISIGFRVHDLTCSDEHLYAQTVVENGGDCVQLAPFKSFSNVRLQNLRLNKQTSTSIYRQFQNQHIEVRILGCYVNIISLSEKKRRDNLKLFKNYLDNSCYFNHAFVGTETGSVSSNGYTDSNFTESAFQRVLNSVYEIADYAEQKDVDFAIEPGINHPLYSVEKTERLIKLIGSKHLKIIFDLANLMTKENYHEQEKILDDAFLKFGEKICVFHLKDFRADSNKKIEMVPFFKGDLDYRVYLKKIKELSKNRKVYCTFENCKDVDQKQLTRRTKQLFDSL